MCSVGVPPFPTSEKLLILFVADISQCVVYATIRTYLAAVRHGHVVQGLPDPLANGQQLELVLRGVCKHSVGSGRVQLPITLLVLLQVK